MWKISSVLCLLVSSALVVSCASERKVTYSKAKAKSTDLSKFQSSVKYVTDEKGNVQPNSSSKRSQFENAKAFATANNLEGQSYNKKSYRKNRWGKKQFSKDSYSGNKDGSQYQYSPHFVQQQARAQGQSARVGEQGYQTSQYYNNKGEVDRGRDISNPQDAETNVRRSVYKAPPIQSLDNANGLSVEQTKDLLGR